MCILMFFGLDGSGKTTLARALAKDLYKQGFKVKVEWMRGTHTLAFILAKLMALSGKFKGPDNPYYKISIPQKMRGLWQLIEFMSVIPVVIFKLILPSFLGYFVIAERSPIDFVVWVSRTTRDLHYINNREARFLLSLNALAKVFVSCSLEELSKRRRNNHHVSREEAYLYEKLFSMLGSYNLDTTGKGVEESLNELRTLIVNILNRND